MFGSVPSYKWKNFNEYKLWSLVSTKKLTNDNMKLKSLWINFLLAFFKSEKFFANIKLQILK